MLSGCQTAINPDQVTRAFWEAMAQGNVDSARKYATQDTQYLVVKQQYLQGTSVKTGAITIDGLNAKVVTVIALNKPKINKDLSFDTVLLKEHNLWKVDFRQTLNNVSILPLGEIFENLRGIGNAINKELEQQIPLFENQIKSFNEELKRQLEDFRRQLEKSTPPEKPSVPGAI